MNDKGRMPPAELSNQGLVWELLEEVTQWQEGAWPDKLSDEIRAREFALRQEIVKRLFNPNGLRDRFAMAALNSIHIAFYTFHREEGGSFDFKQVAKDTYQLADAMLAERNKEPNRE